MTGSSLLLTVGAGCMLVASLLSKGSVRFRRLASRAAKLKQSA